MQIGSATSSRIELPEHIRQSSNGEAANFLRTSLKTVPDGSRISVVLKGLPPTADHTAIARVLYNNSQRLQIGIET